MKNKGFWTLFGLALFIIGITAITLQMVGVQWVFLAFLEKAGRLFAFIVKILMVLGGFILIVLARTDWEQERRESGGE